MTDLHLDQWAPLNHLLSEVRELGSGQWRPPQDQRRDCAYTVLRAVQTNNLWQIIPPDEEGERPELDEWGEAALLVSRIVAGLLSRRIRFVIEGADKKPPPIARIPDPIPEPDRNDPSAVAAYEAAVARRTADAEQAIAEWEQAHDDYQAAAAWQRWWDEWQEAEQFIMKLGDLERSYTVPLGDGVLVHAWDSELGRPTVHVVDPAEYFPVLDQDSPRWPTRVHRAWEADYDNPDGTIDERLYRVTWDTVELDRPRALPWNTQPTTKTVRLTEHYWRRGSAGTWNGLDVEEAETVKIVEDTGLDFIPVVHVPNTAETVNHFGVSSLSLYIGLIEAIARQNRNIMGGADLAATPAFTSTGVKVPDVALGPGAVLHIGENGELNPLELGPSLEPLMKAGDWLRDQFATNTQLGRAILGLVTTGEGASSGVKLRLQFGPFEQLIDTMRPIRADKYALSAKMVMRLAQHGTPDRVPTGPPPRVRVDFGPITPADLSAVVDEINKLDGDISTATKLARLKSSGWDEIGDIEDEIRRLEAEDIEGAAAMVEAIGDHPAVYSRLGVAASEPVDPITGNLDT